MRKTILGAIFCATMSGNAVAQAPVAPAPIPADVQRTLDQLRVQALAGDGGFSVVEGLTTEVGQRLAGSAAEARARDWAQAMLRAHGFTNVHVEPFTVPGWARTSQSARILSPAPQNLAIAALGGSPSTPAGGIDADIVRFRSIAELRAAPREAVAGRIVFIDEGMIATMDGAGYGAAVARRGACPAAAQAQGALACLIRSVGTDSHRLAHTGGSARQRDGANLPAAALSNPDADQLARLAALGPVRVHLEIGTAMSENAPSGNVIGEIRGRERPDEVVLLGAHLDSWDLGTGAIDDGAGVAIMTATAELIGRLGRHPRRTIRVVLFGDEEMGGLGGIEYARAHANEIAHIVLTGESDLGSGRAWRLRTAFGAGAEAQSLAMARALAPLGVIFDTGHAHGGTDIEPLMEAHAPGVDLGQNALTYFDIHHTADDTLDKIAPADLAQNVAAWASIVYLAAEMDWDLRAAP